MCNLTFLHFTVSSMADWKARVHKVSITAPERKFQIALTSLRDLGYKFSFVWFIKWTTASIVADCNSQAKAILLLYLLFLFIFHLFTVQSSPLKRSLYVYDAFYASISGFLLVPRSLGRSSMSFQLLIGEFVVDTSGFRLGFKKRR